MTHPDTSPPTFDRVGVAGDTTAVVLGATYRDTVTGYIGTAVAATDWLFGCVRVTLARGQLSADGVLSSDDDTFDFPALVYVAPPTAELSARIGAYRSDHASQEAPRPRTGGDRPGPTRPTTARPAAPPR